MAQSHEEMIKEFAKLAGALGGNPGAKPNKWKLLGRKIAAGLIKLSVALVVVLALSVLGWVFLDALREVGVIAWQVNFWQGIRLFAPVLLLLLATPITLNIRMKN